MKMHGHVQILARAEIKSFVKRKCMDSGMKHYGIKASDFESEGCELCLDAVAT